MVTGLHMQPLHCSDPDGQETMRASGRMAQVLTRYGAVAGLKRIPSFADRYEFPAADRPAWYASPRCFRGRLAILLHEIYGVAITRGG
jgi:hypothetical protein